ncbi:hypothetical protein GF380_02770 [Candidatus Uhrbacteria bacterium]|nr:hypothetical protein [Candidatus Uhrbacteria bacterium]
MQTIAGKIDQVLVQLFGGYGSLASYSIAILIPEQLKGFVKSTGGILLKRLSQHEDTETRLKATQRHFWIGIGLAAIGTLMYIGIAPLLIPLLFPAYADAVLPTIVYALGMIVMPTMVGLHYFNAHNRMKKLWTFYGLNSTLQIISTLVFIPLFGGWGAIWAKTVTRFISLPFGYPSKPKPTTTSK